MSNTSRRLYVTGFYESEPQILIKSFDIFGDVQEIEMGRDTPRGEHYAYVTMKDKEDCAYIWSMYKQDKSQFTYNNDNNCKLTIHQVEPNKQTLFLGGLHHQATENVLHKFFLDHEDKISDIRVKYSADGSSRGFGFITFDDAESIVEKYVSQRYFKLLGKTMEIKKCDDSLKGRPKSNTRSLSRSSTTSSSSRFSRSVTFGNRKAGRSSSENWRTVKTASRNVMDNPKKEKPTYNERLAYDSLFSEQTNQSDKTYKSSRFSSSLLIN